MKRIVSLLMASSALAQQSSIATRTFDINGRAVDGARTVQENGSKLVVTRDANGRAVPVESVEERVVSEAGGVRVVERSIKRYDADGVPGPPERVRVEEQKQSDGTTRTLTTISRGDLNGGFQLAERATTVVRVAGDRTESTTSVERPTLNGSFELYERRDEAVTASAGKTAENVTTYRRDSNGRLSEFARKTREALTAGGTVNENTAEYESAATGKMRLMRQSTARIDATGSREVNLYLPDNEGRLTLSQHQSIEKRETSSGTIETTVVRLATGSAPGQLGQARKAEEIVCTGGCGKKP